MENTPRKAKAHVQQPGFTPSGHRKDIVKQTHANTDKTEKNAMKEVALHKLHVLPKLVLPDEALGITPEEMMDGFKKRGLYDGGRWVEWKDNAMSEKDVSDFLNKLADVVDEMLEESWKLRGAVGETRPKRPKRHWSYAAINKPVRGDSMNRKPDLICMIGKELEWYMVDVCGQN